MNNKILYIEMILALCVAFNVYGEARVVEYPIIGYTNVDVLDIASVELNDSTTILNFNVRFRPMNWIKIVSESYIVADGNKYPLKSVVGIVPDVEFQMPESGQTNFRLFFEPIPYSTKTIDFIEGFEKGGFRLMDIDLTESEMTEYPEGIPDTLKKKNKDIAVPDPAFEIGKTTINFHLCPYYPEVDNDFSVWVETMDGGQQEYYLNFDENGKASLTFDQYGTAKAAVASDRKVYSTLFLYPGESIDCYLDLRLSAADLMVYKRNIPKEIFKKSIHSGKYGDYDRSVADANNLADYRLHIGGRLRDYHMTGDEYKNCIKEQYQSLSESINNANISNGEKEYCMLQLQSDVLHAIIEYRRILEQMYRFVNRDWSPSIPSDSVPAFLSEKDYEEVTDWFDVSNPKLLMMDHEFGTIGSKPGLIYWSMEGGPGELPESLYMFGEMARKARQQNLSDADIADLKILSNPFFADACDSIAERAAREYLELQKYAHEVPTPEVADDKVFDAIVAPYKGKVVVVDLWNTWCAPCRHALKHNEPLKSGELSREDLVWIYIADDTSDPVKYLEMLPEIKGIHYKVNADQIRAILERFNVDGIPYYIIIDRDGNAEGRPDLRDHSLYIREIKSKF